MLEKFNSHKQRNDCTTKTHRFINLITQSQTTDTPYQK